MIEKSLRKVIMRLLIPKYPYIDWFNIDANTDNEYETLYVVTVVINKDLKNKDLYNLSSDKDLQKLNDELKSMFAMLGPKSNERLRIIYV